MDNTQKQSKRQGFAREVYDWVETFCVALAAVVLVFTFVCKLVTVDGQSMEQTLQDGNKLIISNLFYEPEYGDIVVVQDTTEPQFKGPIIKRVIATEGETIDIDFDTWTVTVTDTEGNVRVLEEQYAFRQYNENGELLPMAGNGDYSFSYPHSISEYPHVVAENCVFVMGDNRNNSLDSRFVGDIDKRTILGKAYVRVFPLNKFGLLK